MDVLPRSNCLRQVSTKHMGSYSVDNTACIIATRYVLLGYRHNPPVYTPCPRTSTTNTWSWTINAAAMGHAPQQNKTKSLQSIPVLSKQILCRACRNLIAVITYSLVVSRRPSEHLSWGRSSNAGELVVSSPGLFLELGQKGERGGRTHGAAGRAGFAAAGDAGAALGARGVVVVDGRHGEAIWIAGCCFFVVCCLLFSGVDLTGGLEMQRRWFVGFGGEGRGGLYFRVWGGCCCRACAWKRGLRCASLDLMLFWT